MRLRLDHVRLRLVRGKITSDQTLKTNTYISLKSPIHILWFSLNYKSNNLKPLYQLLAQITIKNIMGKKNPTGFYKWKNTVNIIGCVVSSGHNRINTINQTSRHGNHFGPH